MEKYTQSFNLCRRLSMALIYILLFAGLAVFSDAAIAQDSGGSISLLRMQTASTLQPRRLDLRTNTRFFTKLGDYLGSNKPANFSAVNFWSVQGNALLTYGISENFDATFAVRVYQDTHKKNEYNAPSDISIDLKGGGFQLGNNKLQAGGIFGLILPTGEKHNYPFEEYAPDAVQFRLTGLLSYYNDPFLPDRDYSFHLNLGWHYYNDAGKALFDSTDLGNGRQILAGNNASAIKYGVGFSYPTELFDLNLEFWGSAFTTKPDSFAFSRENYAYLTPSLRFKPRWWMNFDLGLDIRVSNDVDESLPPATFKAGNLDLPNYASWRMTMGLSLVLNGGEYRYKSGGNSTEEVRSRVNFYDRLLKEREKARSIEEELRRLKREREQAERELEELRQLLEEEK